MEALELEAVQLQEAVQGAVQEAYRQAVPPCRRPPQGCRPDGQAPRTQHLGGG